MGLTDLFFRTSSRTFHVADDEGRARRAVGGMTIADGAPGGLPPGVLGVQSGPGHFHAMSPFAVFDAQVSVRGDGRGGSYVTETKRVFSPFPGFSYVADKIHDVATNPQDAYFRSRSRT